MARSRVLPEGPHSRLMIAIVVIAILGLADATYLTIVHYVGFKILACAGGSGHSSCETVQSSQWSEVAGVPVALMGLIGYLLLLGSLFVPGELGRVSTFLIALVGFLFSLYLTSREAFSIHAYCEYCLGSAGCLTVLTFLTAWRFIRTPPTLA